MITFDSTKQAARAMGLEPEYLYSAKSLGCPNFRNGRVYPRGIVAWLSKNRYAIAEDLEARIHEWSFKTLDKRDIESVKKKLAKLESEPAVDVLAGLEGKIVGLTAEQAAAVVAELRTKLKAA